MEHLSYKASWSLFVWGFEACVQNICMFWVLTMGKSCFFDMLAITGYKFVALCPIVVVDLLFGFYPSYIAVFAFGALFSLFFFNTMSRYAHSNTLAAHMNQASLNKKTFLFGDAASQVALILLLSFY